MRDVDQVSGSLLQGLSLQLGDTVFRHHVIRILTGSGDSSAVIDEGRDLGDHSSVPCFGNGGHGDDSLSLIVQCHGSAAHEVHLTAYAGELLRSDGVGNDLSHEVHRQRGIDADHVVVLGDDHRVVDIVHGAHFQTRVSVGKIVQLFRPHQEGDDALTGIQRLFGVVDDAGFHQIHHAIGDHLGMDPQVLLVL